MYAVMEIQYGKRMTCFKSLSSTGFFAYSSKYICKLKVVLEKLYCYISMRLWKYNRATFF